jgi:hypothetical protein
MWLNLKASAQRLMRLTRIPSFDEALRVNITEKPTIRSRASGSPHFFMNDPGERESP